MILNYMGSFLLVNLHISHLVDLNENPKKTRI